MSARSRRNRYDSTDIGLQSPLCTSQIPSYVPVQPFPLPFLAQPFPLPVRTIPGLSIIDKYADCVIINNCVISTPPGIRTVWLEENHYITIKVIMCDGNIWIQSILI